MQKIKVGIFCMGESCFNFKLREKAHKILHPKMAKRAEVL